ncbi:hypothetical protein SAMN05216486_10813 [bacterium JGI 053]|jgi:hypothetical protein|nr:hypothetical protein SAMN05216486_10813 [bacterium JGI 053]
MKKLHLDGLKVDSFATAPRSPAVRGTVAGREIDTNLHCPDSYNGTCWVTCWDSCQCDSSVYVCN